MNRRDLVAEGFRCLAQVLPGLVVTAGSLGLFLQQSIQASVDQPASCFPAKNNESVSTTSPPISEEE